MIRRRLYYNNLFLRITALLLPALAFIIAGLIQFGSGLFGTESNSIDRPAYMGLLLFTSLVWAIVSDRFGLCRFDELFAAGGKTRKLITACVITYASIMTATFFYRSVSFSRMFVFLTAVLLVLLAWAARVTFRVELARERRSSTRFCRILVVGT